MSVKDVDGAWSDIWVNEEVVGQGGAMTKGHNGTEETQTSTVVILYPLKLNDSVHVQFNKGDPNSYMHSDKHKSVHFTARLVQFA